MCCFVTAPVASSDKKSLTISHYPLSFPKSFFSWRSHVTIISQPTARPTSTPVVHTLENINPSTATNPFHIPHARDSAAPSDVSRST